MYVINLDYLEDKLLCFRELLDSDTEELNRMLIRLYIAAVILETNNQNLLDLIELETKWANKKKEKAEIC